MGAGDIISKAITPPQGFSLLSKESALEFAESFATSLALAPVFEFGLKRLGFLKPVFAGLSVWSAAKAVYQASQGQNLYEMLPSIMGDALAGGVYNVFKGGMHLSRIRVMQDSAGGFHLGLAEPDDVEDLVRGSVVAHSTGGGSSSLDWDGLERNLDQALRSAHRLVNIGDTSDIPHHVNAGHNMIDHYKLILGLIRRAKAGDQRAMAALKILMSKISIPTSSNPEISSSFSGFIGELNKHPVWIPDDDDEAFGFVRWLLGYAHQVNVAQFHRSRIQVPYNPGNSSPDIYIRWLEEKEVSIPTDFRTIEVGASTPAAFYVSHDQGLLTLALNWSNLRSSAQLTQGHALGVRRLMSGSDTAQRWAEHAIPFLNRKLRLETGISLPHAFTGPESLDTRIRAALDGKRGASRLFSGLSNTLNDINDKVAAGNYLEAQRQLESLISSIKRIDSYAAILTDLENNLKALIRLRGQATRR